MDPVASFKMFSLHQKEATTLLSYQSPATDNDVIPLEIKGYLQKYLYMVCAHLCVCVCVQALVPVSVGAGGGWCVSYSDTFLFP